MRAKEIMTKDPDCLSGDDTARRAAQVMRDRDCGCVPIVDGAGKVVGIVTDRDLAVRGIAAGKDTDHLQPRRRFEGRRAEDGRATGTADSDRRRGRTLRGYHLPGRHRAGCQQEQHGDRPGDCFGGGADIPAKRARHGGQGSQLRVRRVGRRAAVLAVNQLQLQTEQVGLSAHHLFSCSY